MPARHGGLADALRKGDSKALDRVVSGVITLRPDNLVERPWGGRKILAYKGLDGTRPYGEAFEVSAFADDPEAAAHPSIAILADGSEIPLPELLGAAADDLLGAPFVRRFGGRIPLLPKTLDIAELLSVQVHPPGNPELYVVIDADRGATIRLGLRRDVDRPVLRRDLEKGLRLQQRLGAALDPDADQHALQEALAPTLDRRGVPAAEMVEAIGPFLAEGVDRVALQGWLDALRAVHWRILDLLNEIPVVPGQVIYNRQPAIHGKGSEATPCADIHALGNPERREILMLEIRRPASTLRAWDHVRFPARRIDLEESLAAISGRATDPDHFTVEPSLEAGRPGVAHLVSDRLFEVDLLRPDSAHPIDLPPRGSMHSLHVIRGEARIVSAGGSSLAALQQGRSALLPASLGGCVLTAEGSSAEVVRVTIPV